MKTIHLSQQDMRRRVARYTELAPLATQTDAAVPLAARDLMYARKLLSVIGLEDAATPISSDAPIKGAAGMTMTLAVCPPGQGPELHAHRRTFETFTVLRGRFEVRWNDDGAERLELGELDTISVPPGVCRAFRNVGDAAGILQVIITGGVHDMQDIDFARRIAGQLEAISPGARAYFERAGFTFTAGCDD
ncbi:MAG: cupin domain-containing protein [Burkholderiales bacterium]|nr:cupin domain-containing protein [Burkholderiales bacterium]